MGFRYADVWHGFFHEFDQDSLSLEPVRIRCIKQLLGTLFFPEILPQHPRGNREIDDNWCAANSDLERGEREGPRIIWRALGDDFRTLIFTGSLPDFLSQPPQWLKLAPG